MTYNALISQNGRMIDTALKLDGAAEQFARNCNGNNGHIIPAPTVYELLGNLKVALWNVGEVVDYLPTGLTRSIEQAAECGVTVTDRDWATGEPRDPQESLRQAITALRTARASLQGVAQALEAAQSAISGQGFEPIETGL
jgi:hypothetical protein